MAQAATIDQAQSWLRTPGTPGPPRAFLASLALAAALHALVLFGVGQQQASKQRGFRIRDDSIFGRVKQRMRDWFYAEFD